MSIRLTQFYYFLPPPSSVILTDLGFKSLYRTRPIRRRRSPQFQLFAENKGGGGGGGGDQKDGERELFRWRDLLDPDPENILAVGLTALLGLASLQALWQLLLTSLAILLGALKYSFVAAIILFILITLL